MRKYSVVKNSDNVFLTNFVIPYFSLVDLYFFHYKIFRPVFTGNSALTGGGVNGEIMWDSFKGFMGDTKKDIFQTRSFGSRNEHES